MTPGSIPIGPSTPGAPPPAGSGICPSGDPCVLTGQYSRSRTSANPNETTLANFDSTSASTFGLASFYAPTSPLQGTFTYEPVVAQPLYATNVPTAGGTENVLVVGSLNDYVYGFDTSSGAQLWPKQNLATNCGTGGTPFENTPTHNPGGANLDYYEIVATPVIDTLPADAIAFVVSACTPSWGSTAIEWYLDAINIQSGAVWAHVQLTDASFNGPYELARPSLLLSHPTDTTSDLYIAFGTGAGELQAATSCGSNCAYTGVLFGYSVGYHSSVPYVTFTGLSSSPFYTTCATNTNPLTPCVTTGLFPSVNTSFSYGTDAPTGPECVMTSSGVCDGGDNWFNGGGIWMSSKGPASTASASVYVASGNGAFACATTGTSCTAASGVEYWGESAMKFPSATASSPMTPVDFFAPYTQWYTYNKSPGDSNPAPYQTEELSRMDLDFGSSGVVIVPHTTTFAMNADKSGYLYVMPAEANSLGSFQLGDAGLTGGTVTTQDPFQVSRYPRGTNQGACPINTDSPDWTYTTTSCDEVHELGLWAANDLLFVWPVNESVEVFQGTYSSTSYFFGTAPTFDPCLTSGNCTGVTPHFPRSQPNSEGGVMALAIDSAGAGTLWGLVPRQNTATPTPSYVWGSLYAYTITPATTGPPPMPATLTYRWDSVSGHNCSSPPATGWFTTSFTEPTLANGAAYVPALCAVTDGNQYQYCGAVPTGAVASGILVFGTCP